ncbi:MAG: hypothetical protein KJ620_08320 [Candidatus Edwardsbacteria bacterium]|nr:hypothetical protein [Candidatus Edwardsbacteria bacterium]MBU1575583.1 hypothetical protein [Candidatus Edwardsbacteria bacterium]MBU2463423.1 hypothetical protein [Candidatus Edwardsbacteria bacterium]MBU2593848.1 hypothetical protein [Candidatus Edwardsbacteria bacterium]
METNYLTWFKDLYQDICHRDDIFSLLSSNVSEPKRFPFKNILIIGHKFDIIKL